MSAEGKCGKMHDFQKPNIWKRISAAFLDIVLVVMVAVLVAWLIFTALGSQGYSDKLDVKNAEYAEKYGIVATEEKPYLRMDPTTEEYEKFTEEERKALEDAYLALNNDAEALKLLEMLLSIILLTMTFSVLISQMIFEFVIPLIFGNGQTVGKKVFGIGVMREDGVKVTAPLMFIRALLGKYTIETMIPIYLFILIQFGLMGVIAYLVIALILITQVVAVCATRTHSAIHDKFSRTVTVDFQSQKIFDTVEEMVEYKQRIHKESADSADY